VTQPEFSVVVPAYNEQDSLPELARRLRAVLERLEGTSEVILVDDGSADRTWDVMRAEGSRDPRFKALRLSRNFGHQAALTAGLDQAHGRAVIAMDADLQDPPEVIVDLVARWREGFDVVHAVRDRREGDSAFKRATASLFYRALRRITDVDIPIDAGDFRLVDHRALDAFKQMPERNRYIRGMFGWVGFRQSTVTYSRSGRYAGESKYPFAKMIRFALDGVTSFSDVPLRMALRLGFILAGLSILGGVVAVILKLTGALIVPGWVSLIVAVTFLGGIQLWMLGVMGEYISRIHDEVRRRPLYLVSDTCGLAADRWAESAETPETADTLISSPPEPRDWAPGESVRSSPG
jgi:polyisoprenyl-phosphate glycosyltransferase